MRKFFLLLIIICLNILSVQAQDDEIRSKDYNHYEVTETDTYYFDELDYAFYQAYNAFLNGRDGLAGARIRRAAYFVRAEANHAEVHNKKPIIKQADRLERLADSIGMGKVHSAFRVRRAIGRTHHVLANDYKMRAASFWTAKKTKEAGKAMRTAAGYLGHAAKWTGEKIEGGAKKTGKSIVKGAKRVGVESYRGIRMLSAKMIQGVAFVPEKVGQGLEWLGTGLKKVGKKVENMDQ